MIPFHTVCPDVARREIRSVVTLDSPGLTGEFAFVEWFCDDADCDCRRVLLEVISRAQSGRTVAWIAFGWESHAFYKEWSVAPRRVAGVMARETIDGVLDQVNPQSPLAPILLDLLRKMVAADPHYRTRLKQHYDLFRKELKRKAKREFGKHPGRPRRGDESA